MQRIIAFALILLACAQLKAQQEIVATATDYITHGHFTRANQYLDSILNLNPKTVDALMMKGNVLLNQAWNNGAKSHFETEKAESIFDSSAIDETYFVPIVPIDTSKLIDNYWRQCLQIDPSRTDIKKGLCNLYSLSLRTGELQNQLLLMQRTITENEDNAYLYAEYARNLKNRGRFDDAMKVYATLAGMFPKLAGIRCDMANEYFYAGYLDKAMAYLDSALSKKEVDQTTFINAAAVYSNLGHYDKAYKTFKRYSEKDTLVEADFYLGLMLFANSDSGFYRQMSKFINAANDQNYYDELQLAKKLLPYSHMPFTYEDYTELLANEKTPRYYRVLILQRGYNQFKDVCDARFNLGWFNCKEKNYKEADKYLSWLLNQYKSVCVFKDKHNEELCGLAAAFSQLKQGQKVDARRMFSYQFNAHNNFVAQAAKYFAAKIDWDEGRRQDARVLFDQVANAPQPTKYSWLAKGYLLIYK